MTTRRALADTGSEAFAANAAHTRALVEALRAQGFTDAELAGLAAGSVRASFACEASKRTWLAEIDAWLAAED